MSKLHTMEKLVLEILEESVAARQDDYILFIRVCEKTNPQILDVPFGLAMKIHYFQLPNWESVARSRRKIQKKRPDLVEEETARKRRKAETEYRKYAKS